MAVLDTEANEIVIRVVYDGSPEAGKTTSLRALAGSLAQTVITPEETPDGRTLWFDWMDYVGGRFEGSRIRCQIVSVPGQRALYERRKRLVVDADVVVSVFDSTPDGATTSFASLEELRRMLRVLPGPPVGVVLQANKRDCADAVPLEELRRTLGGWSVGLVESIAADGTGIREAFVYAVRLALDRVRELITSGTLRTGEPELRSADQLLATLSQAEVPPPIVASAGDSVAAALLDGVLAAEAAAAERTVVPWAGHVPRAPDTEVPSGAIWPPVEGRAILYEVARLGLVPERTRSGDWLMGRGTCWRVLSHHDSCHGSLDEGRAALIQWARLHAASLPMISTNRCIVLADAGDGSWRLWQIVREEETLRQLLMRALHEETPELIVLRLCQAGKLLLELAARIAQSPCDLPCTLDSVGATDTGGVYIGVMPSSPAPESRPVLVAPTLLRTQLEPVVALARAGERNVAVRRVLARVPHATYEADTIMSTVISLFA